MEDFNIQNEQEFIQIRNSELENQNLNLQLPEDAKFCSNSSQKQKFFNNINGIYSRRNQNLAQNKNLQRIDQQNFKHPKLPNKSSDKKYTLVLDIDETLVRTQFGGGQMKVLLRPYVQEFLQKLSLFYEIVTFTAGTKAYSEKIVSGYLDPEQKYIDHQLSRENCKQYIDKSDHSRKICVKDISQLNRDINTVLIIDNIAENFSRLQPFNGIEVKSYYGIFDQVLLNLIPILQYIAEKMIDVRSFVYSSIWGFKLQNLGTIVEHINKKTVLSCHKTLKKLQEQVNSTSVDFTTHIIDFFMFIIIYIKYIATQFGAVTFEVTDFLLGLLGFSLQFQVKDKITLNIYQNQNQKIENSKENPQI